MRIHELPAVDQTDGVFLDVRPLAAPVSPFAWMAKNLEETDYPNAAAAKQGAAAVRWFRHLAKRLPSVTSDDPVIMSAIAQCAMSGEKRAAVRAALDQLEAAILEANHG